MGPDAWRAWQEDDGKWQGGEVVHGQIADFGTVDRAREAIGLELKGDLEQFR